MAYRVLIPTPLRPYTGQQDAVEVDGATVGEVLSVADARYADLRRHLYARRRQAAALRQRLRQRRRHPVSGTRGDGAQVGRRHQHRAVGRRRRAGDRNAAADAGADQRRKSQRYSRHLILPEVGVDGQRRLKAGRVLCVGAGGLGSPAALYLAAAGVGTLGIIDFDAVDVSNLQRQILHGTPDVGRSKLQSARERLNALNPERRDRDARDGADLQERARALPRLRRHPRRHRQLLRRGIWSTTPACSSASRTPTAASSGSKGRRRCLRPRAARAIAASIPNRRRRAGAELRRRRRARRAARRHRHDSGDRSHQADARRRHDAHRPPAAVRRLEHALPRAEAAARSGLPGLRRSSDRPRADRLRPVLRHRAAGGRAAASGGRCRRISRSPSRS